MPKSGKPKGGRPSRNFEPRFAKKTSFHDRHAGPGSRPAGGRDERTDAGDRGSSSERPRTSDRLERRPGSKSPSHRGHRPTDAESGAPKRRWTDQDRAGRDEARGIRGRAESGRRETPHNRDERPRYNSERPSGERRFDDRPRRDERGGERPRFQGDRPRFANDRNGRGSERPRANGDRNERPRFTNDRGAERPRFDNDRGTERPRFTNDRNDRGTERPRSTNDRNERGAERPRSTNDRNERPRFTNDRNERPRFTNDRNERGGERPRFNRDERPNRDDRPRYSNDRDDRPRSTSDRNDRGGERPRFTRDERPNRDDRPRYNNDRNERPRFANDRNDGGTERPRFNRDERPNRDDRPRSTNDRNDRGGERPRFNRDERPNRDDRPRFNSDRSERPRRDDRAQRPARDNWNSTGSSHSGAKFTPTEDVVHEKLAAKVIAAPEVEGTTFGDLGLGSNIVETLSGMGAATPFPIQAATIPSILAGRDVLGRGRTGSGKTIAFGAPLVESILKSQAGKRREFGRKPRAIILAPTRELALQLDRTIQPIARSVGLFTTQIYGGVPQGRQVGALMKGVDIVIGTPGRIEDLIKQRKLDLSECQIAVLDEADHMCELGFVEPVQRILRHTQEGSQKLLFSATLDREVAALVDEFLVDPAVYEVAGEDQDSSTIEHRVLVIEHRDKAEILTSLVDREGKTLVFARTRAYAETLTEQFEDAGIPAVSLHGDLNQTKRTRNLQKLTSGRVNVLVATDVAARGIHVDDVDLVIQADAPDEYKTYMHRAGRTGRAGRAGRVVTLITRQRERRTSELLARAEIEAPFEQARLGDDILEEIAGRMPSSAELTA